MTRIAKVLLIGNAIFMVWNLSGTTINAQRPAPINPEGIPYLNVNINPTETPPMVNVNPYGMVPSVEVTRMPEIRFTPFGCDNGRNFYTGIGRSISGPLVVTFLNTTQDTEVSLSGGGDSRGRRFTLSSTRSLATAIYLGAGQRLDFGNDVMYSGCQPN